MLSFLSKLGEIIVRGAAIVSGFEPILEAAAPKQAGVIQTVNADLSAMANIVVQIEAASQAIKAGGGTMTSDQKLAAAVALIGPIVKQSSLIAGHQIADAALLQKGVGEIAQGVVDTLQSVHPDAANDLVTAKVNGL